MTETNTPAPTARADRPKSKRISLLRRLMPFFAGHRTDVILAGAALVTAAAFTLVMPIAVRRMIDLGFSADTASTIDRYFAALVFVAACLGLATALRYYFVTRLGERVVANLRKAVYDNAIGLSPVFFEKVRTGEALSRLTTDTTVVETLVSSSISIALRNILLLIGGLAMLLITSVKLTALVLVGVPLVIIPIVVIGRRVRALSKETQDKIAETSAVAGETLGAVRDVQSYTQEDVARGRYGAAVEGAFDAARRRITQRALLTAIVIFFVFTAIVSVLWVGARDVIAGSMTAGELGQFILYALITAGAVGALSEIWGQLQQAAGATERLIEILDSEPAIAAPDAPVTMPAPRGDIAFENLKFSFPSRPDVQTLDGLDLTVNAGETVAIVGPSGAGKTTLFHLIQRFYDPQGGRVLLDGVDLRDADPQDVRARLAIVPQEPAIFATTVRENILFGREGATDAEAIDAAKAAAAHDFISALPEGYETYVGERGVMLSGGQKQRIAIARAILRNASVLLLDEATSALDAESERAVQEAFARVSQGRTTLVIAHRLATVKQADRIIVMQDGKIVGMGAHGALIEEGGLYARLAKLQFVA